MSRQSQQTEHGEGRGGRERDAKLAGNGRPGARGEGMVRYNIKQSGAWPYCSIPCQSSPRRTAHAGAASPYDWLGSSKVCASVLLRRVWRCPGPNLPGPQSTTSKRMQGQGPGFAKRAGAASSQPMKKSDSLGAAEGNGPSSIIVCPSSLACSH
ncbi:hypothetical protein VTI28DRAFT_10335 [Corynascus sepedonium]